jgi:hypothetical protein
VGASVSHEGGVLKCSRSDESVGADKRKEKRRTKKNIPKENQRETKSSRCGCKFAIRYSTARKGLPPNAQKGAVFITDRSFYRHTHGCFPCQSQLIVEKRKAGHYETGLKQEQLRSIIAVLEPGMPVPCQVLREMMRPLYPGSVAIDAQDVCNMRWKVKRILERKEKDDEAPGLSSSDEKDLLRRDDRLVALDSLPAEHVPIGRSVHSQQTYTEDTNEDFASANNDHDYSDDKYEGDSQLEESRLLLQKKGGAYSLLRGKFDVAMNNINNAEQGLYAIRAMDKLASDLMAIGYQTSGVQQSQDGTVSLPATNKKRTAERERPQSSPAKKDAKKKQKRK